MTAEARYGDVHFKLAGREYTIRYGNLAWDSVHPVLGTNSPGQVLSLVLAGDKGARGAFFHAAFATYHPEVTVEQAMRLYDELAREGERTLWSACWEAVKVAMPQLDALEKAASPKEEPAAPESPTRRPARRSAKRR